MQTENTTLKTLSILHYVFGGLTAFFSCFPLLHVAMGIAILSGLMEEEGTELIGWMFIIFPMIMVLTGWILAGFIIAAGRKLGAHKSKLFCQIVAGIECVLLPIGTALGATTLVLLSQPENANAFSHPVPPAVPPTL